MLQFSPDTSLPCSITDLGTELTVWWSFWQKNNLILMSLSCLQMSLRDKTNGSAPVFLSSLWTTVLSNKGEEN